jgi:hypothetical protein
LIGDVLESDFGRPKRNSRNGEEQSRKHSRATDDRLFHSR